MMLRGRATECARLDRLLAAAHGGESQVLVVRGEAGVGKTALLEHVLQQAASWRIGRAAGIEAELELAFAGLHQLCAPMLDGLGQLPAPQATALATAFGLSSGEPPDRFLVALAVLSLLAHVAEEGPLVCLVDDAQWLDQVSAQTLAFVARRLLAERIALVFAVRDPTDSQELAGLPELVVGGLGDDDSRAILASVIPGPVDEGVRERIIAETRGNPLALLEITHGMTAAELAGFGGSPADGPGALTSRLEEGFVRRLAGVPADTRLLVLAAAAEPVGDANLLWRAVGRLGIAAEAAAAAEATGLIEVGAHVRFRHPLVRSAIYRAATAHERHEVHRALAQETDAELDPDRRAWHLARATFGLDEAVALELERSAGRAQRRGGLAAAMALLERAAHLTPAPDRRADRELAAARAMREAGALEAALGLLNAAEAGPFSALRAGGIAHLRGQIAFDQRRAVDAVRLLLDAASQLGPLDPELARQTYLEALSAAMWASGPGAPDALAAAAAAVRSAPLIAESAASSEPSSAQPRSVDAVLDALATRFTEGYTAAAPLLTGALEAFLRVDTEGAEPDRTLWLIDNRASGIIATEVWDFDSGRQLGERQVQRARDAGALVQLQFALNFLAMNRMLAGELSAAAALLEEDRTVAEATGNPPVAYTGMLLAALHGEEESAVALIAGSRRQAAALGQGRIVTFADYATAVLHNGLGRYEEARDAARRVFVEDVVGGYQTLATAELAEAASRTGDIPLVEQALERMSERARATPTASALGIEARLRALLQSEAEADVLYRESIEHLRRSGLRVELARGQLLYGEWLRRAGKRVEAREQLRAAHDALSELGLRAFAERARRELLATGEKARKRSYETAGALTAQELQIAQFARDGLSNPEIGGRLFLSPRTVEWHLRKVFTKLAIDSRRQLRGALPV